MTEKGRLRSRIARTEHRIELADNVRYSSPALCGIGLSDHSRRRSRRPLKCLLLRRKVRGFELAIANDVQRQRCPRKLRFRHTFSPQSGANRFKASSAKCASRRKGSPSPRRWRCLSVRYARLSAPVADAVGPRAWSLLKSGRCSCAAVCAFVRLVSLQCSPQRPTAIFSTRRRCSCAGRARLRAHRLEPSRLLFP